MTSKLGPVIQKLGFWSGAVAVMGGAIFESGEPYQSIAVFVLLLSALSIFVFAKRNPRNLPFALWFIGVALPQLPAIFGEEGWAEPAKYVGRAFVIAALLTVIYIVVRELRANREKSKTSKQAR